ncbi:MAG: hypothetical protein IT260_06640 [Saprospiraceae bacterium]|nr:hypothetical protein [Saprospiraceae bacterium]
MKNFKNLFLLALAVGSMSLTSCLHILEEVTVKKDGSGTYKMTLDMSEIKSMMEMFKGMAPDSLSGDSTGVDMEIDSDSGDNGMSEMGQQLSGVASSLKGISGLNNVKEINDTTSFNFGYSFEFANVDALNKAMKVINKEKYDSKVDEVFKFNGKSFERLATGDLGEEIKKALAENEGEDADAEGGMEMMKNFFTDMTYKQVYHFPDREVKKSSNSLSELSDNGHTLTITLKPFDEEQQKQKVNVGTVVKLK